MNSDSKIETEIMEYLAKQYPKPASSWRELPGHEQQGFLNLLWHMNTKGMIDAKFRLSRRLDKRGEPVAAVLIKANSKLIEVSGDPAISFRYRRNGEHSNYIEDKQPNLSKDDLPMPDTRQPKRNEIERSGLLNRIRGEDETTASDRTKHRPLLSWLKEIHQAERMPTGGEFLKVLKNYENPNKERGKGPIIRVVNSGDAGGRGLQFNIGKGLDFYNLTNLQKRCSEWRNKDKSKE